MSAASGSTPPTVAPSASEQYIVHKLVTGPNELIATVESAPSWQKGLLLKASTQKETLEQREKRLMALPTDQVFHVTNWSDQIMLVALGRKPVCFTHYNNTKNSTDLDPEVENWALEQKHIQSMPVMEFPSNVKSPDTHESIIYLSNKDGTIRKTPTSAANELAGIIWSTAHHHQYALAMRHIFNLDHKGKGLMPPYHHICMALLGGANAEQIKTIVLREFPQIEAVEVVKYHTTSQKYLQAIAQRYK